MPTDMIAVPVVLLAGGQARRMGGRDKGMIVLHGQRLVDRIVERLERQTRAIFIAGRSDYGLGLPLVSDDPAYNGPVAAILGAASSLQNHLSSVTAGFVTVPIDGPNVPSNLVMQLAGPGNACAYARDDGGAHPTFAFWTFEALAHARESLSAAPSLLALAHACQAQQRRWPGSDLFANLNSAMDVEAFVQREHSEQASGIS